jgi:hypothetical protein
MVLLDHYSSLHGPCIVSSPGFSLLNFHQKPIYALFLPLLNFLVMASHCLFSWLLILNSMLSLFSCLDDSLSLFLLPGLHVLSISIVYKLSLSLSRRQPVIVSSPDFSFYLKFMLSLVYLDDSPSLTMFVLLAIFSCLSQANVLFLPLSQQ